MAEYDAEQQVEQAFNALKLYSNPHRVNDDDVAATVSDLRTEDFSSLFDRLRDYRTDVVSKGVSEIKSYRNQSFFTREITGSRSMDDYYENEGRVTGRGYTDQRDAINSVLRILHGIEKERKKA